MPSVEDEIEIQAPIGAVFDALTDPKRGPEWNPNVLGITDLSGYPAGEGTSWKQQTLMGGRAMTVLCRIIQYDAPNEGVLDISGIHPARITTRCSGEGRATRVQQRIEFESPGGLMGQMVSHVVLPRLRRELADTMQRQRKVLEEEAGAADGSPAS